MGSCFGYLFWLSSPRRDHNQLCVIFQSQSPCPMLCRVCLFINLFLSLITSAVFPLLPYETQHHSGCLGRKQLTKGFHHHHHLWWPIMPLHSLAQPSYRQQCCSSYLLTFLLHYHQQRLGAHVQVQFYGFLCWCMVEGGSCTCLGPHFPYWWCCWTASGWHPTQNCCGYWAGIHSLSSYIGGGWKKFYPWAPWRLTRGPMLTL